MPARDRFPHCRSPRRHIPASLLRAASPKKERPSLAHLMIGAGRRHARHLRRQDGLVPSPCFRAVPLRLPSPSAGRAGPGCGALPGRSRRRSAIPVQGATRRPRGRAPCLWPLYQRNVLHGTVFDSTALSTTVQDSSSAAPDSVQKLTVANSTPRRLCRVSSDLANARPLTSASSFLIDLVSDPSHRSGQFLSPPHERAVSPLPSWVSGPPDLIDEAPQTAAWVGSWR